MKVILDMPGIPYDSTQGEIVREWIEDLVKDKNPKNESPLRYVKTVSYEHEGVVG